MANIYDKGKRPEFDRDIQVTPDNPMGLTVSKQIDTDRFQPYAPDYSQYTQARVATSMMKAQSRDSFTEYRFPGGVTESQKTILEKIGGGALGLSAADRIAGDTNVGLWNDMAQQGLDPDVSLITDEDIEYYSSGGVDRYNVDLGVDTPFATNGQSTEVKVSWLSENAPAAIAAIAANGMKPEDVATAHNVYMADSAVNRAMQLVEEGVPLAAYQLVNVLPVRQRLIAVALLDARIADRNVELADVAAEREAKATERRSQTQFDPVSGSISTPMPSDAGMGGVTGSFYRDPSASANMDTLNWLLEATLFGVNNVTQAVRSAALIADVAIEAGGNPNNIAAPLTEQMTPMSGEAQILDSPLAALGAMWQAADSDFVSMRGYSDIMEKWQDPELVNLGRALYEAERSDDPEAVANFKADLAASGNQRAIAAVQAALTGDNINGGKDLAGVMVDFYAADQGNLGNIVAGNLVGLDPGSIPFSVGRDVSNIVSWFALDPLIWVGVAGKAFRGIKYGLQVAEQMGGMGNVIRAQRLGPLAESRLFGRVTGFNGVRAEYNDLGSALKGWHEANDAKDLARAVQIEKNARKRWMQNRNSMIGSEDWAVGKRNKLFTADDWANYFDEVDRAGAILAGKRVAISRPVKTLDDAFNRINAEMRDTTSERILANEGFGLGIKSAVGQQVRRNIYMPHSTYAKATVRGLVASTVGDPRIPAYLDRAIEKMGRIIESSDWESGTAEQKLEALRSALSNDEVIAKALGLELGDWKLLDGAMQRTILGKFADRLYDRGDGAQRVGAAFGLFKKSTSGGTVKYVKVKGWKRDRSLFNPVGRASGARETWARLITRLPNLPEGLIVDTAEHADEVYRMAMAAGLGRGGSDLIRAAWISGNAGSRQNMMIGLVSTFTAAMGIDAVDPQLSRKIITEMTGLRTKEVYAADAIPNEAGVRADIAWEVMTMNGDRRKAIAERMVPQRDRIREIDAEIETLTRQVNRIPDDKAAVKALNADIKMLRGEIATLEKQLVKAEAPLSKTAEARIRKEGVEDWWNLEVNDQSGVVGMTTHGQLLYKLFEIGMGRTPSRVEDGFLRRGYLPRKAADGFESGPSRVYSEEAYALFNDPTGVLPNGMSPTPEWTGIRESAEKFGRQYWIPVPWAKDGIARAADDAVDMAVAPDDYLDDLARQIVGREESIAMAQDEIALLSRNDQATLAKKIASLDGERKKLQARVKRDDRVMLGKIDDETDIRLALKAEEAPGGRLDRALHERNPSVDDQGKASAIYVGQTRGRMAVPNMKAMDQYAARQSYLNALLFQGQAGTAVTEAWVLGSLYGPRFALRNAFEDIAMYLLTGGKVGRFFKGRRLDDAIDESMARVSKEVVARKQAVEKAKKELADAEALNRAGRASDASVDVVRNRYDRAMELLAVEESRHTFMGTAKYGQRTKRGIVRSAVLNVSEKLSYTTTGHERDGVLAATARLLVPTTSPYARREALEAGPEAMVELAEKAILRQNVVWNRPGWQKIIPNRAKSKDDLTAKQLQYLADEDDFLRSSHGLTYKNMAAETAAHLMDGTVPTLTNQGRYVFDESGTELMRVISIDEGYVSKAVNSNTLTPKKARAFMARLDFMTEKYGLNQAALHQIPNYWKALNAPGGMDIAKMDEIIDVVLGVAMGSRDWPFVASRLRLADDLGAKELTRRMMNDMAAAFTKRGSGETDRMALWNQDLWRALRQEDKRKKIRFTTEGINETDFLLGKFDTPASLLVRDAADTITVPARNKWSEAAWAQMGRSMSRMSRNPIFYANYLDSRAAMRPLERQYAKVFGEDMARQKFADAAAERAYELTLSFVDNPTIRTNLSWQVKNVARYYRAQEDFIRRVWRMAKFDPVSIQKANLAWQAQQDFGFVHRDDYGNDYFMYPGSAAVAGAVQNVFGTIGLLDNLKFGVSPVAFGGNVQWLSPSLDLGSAIPTMSSPWMAVTLQPLLREMPMARDFFQVIERVAFGDVSANMDYTELNLGDNFWETWAGSVYQALPPNIKKVIAIGEGLSGVEVPGSYGAKMTMKTIIATEAAGYGLTEEEKRDPSKVREYKETMQRRAVEMSILSLIFGLFAPSSPQYREDNLSMQAREEGFTSLSPALREGITATVRAGGVWEDAYIQWMRDNPRQSAIVTPQSTSVGGTFVEATWKNVDFLKQNEELFREAPLGMTFFTPDPQGAGGGEEGQAAWRAMKQFGLREFRAVGDFVDSVVGAEGRLQSMLLKADMEAIEAGVQHYDVNGNVTDQWRAWTDEKERAKARLDMDYPMNDAGFTVKDDDEWKVTAEQIVLVNRELRGTSAYADAAAGLVDAYREFSTRYEDFLVNGYGAPENSRSDQKTTYKEVWERAVSAWWADNSSRYPQGRAEDLVKVLSKSLNTGWDITLEGN